MCRAHAAALKLCHGCGAEKPSGRGRTLCESCAPPLYKPCAKCGGSKGESVRPGQKLCNVCEEIRVWETERKRAARLRLRRKPCWGCGRPKEDGRRHYCVSCQRNRSLRPCGICMIRPVRGLRKKLCEECHRTAPDRKRQTAAMMRDRIRRDPALLARQREWERRSRNRKRRRRREPPARVPGFLPGRQLGQKLMERAEAEDTPIEVLCERIGVSVRTAYAWREGERDVRSAVADRILAELDLLWWDVWPDSPEAERAFGEAVAA